MIITKRAIKNKSVSFTRPLSYEYDSETQSVVLLDGYLYGIVYDQSVKKNLEQVDLRSYTNEEIDCFGANPTIRITTDLQYYTSGFDVEQNPSDAILWDVEVDGVLYEANVGNRGHEDWLYMEEYIQQNSSLFGLSATYESNVNGGLIINKDSNPVLYKKVRFIPNRPYTNFMEFYDNSTATINSSGVLSFCLSGQIDTPI